MFEKPAMISDERTEEIIQNVRELSRLDPQYVQFCLSCFQYHGFVLSLACPPFVCDYMRL